MFQVIAVGVNSIDPRRSHLQMETAVGEGKEKRKMGIFASEEKRSRNRLAKSETGTPSSNILF